MQVNQSKKLFFLILFVLCILFINKFIKSKLLNDQDKILIKDNVNLIIYPEYDEYFINQDIWIKCDLINNSKDNYYLKLPITIHSVTVIITNPLNEKGNYHTETENAYNDSLELIPGKSTEKLVCLNWVFPRFTSTDIKIYGLYKIKFVYQGIESNEININITEPTGVDKILYDSTFNGIFKPYIPINEKMNKLEKLLDKYPSSKYSPQLYNYLLLSTHNLFSQERYLENINNYFQFNYDTYGSRFILIRYFVYLENELKLDNKSIDLIKDNLITKFPNSKTEYILNKEFELNRTQK